MEHPPAASPPRKSNSLRQELSARNLHRAPHFEHEATCGNTPSIVYTHTEQRTHGNFFPASYRRILANPQWSARLEKAYTASHHIPYTDRRQRHELDCAASSDALLMNIFCHPTALRSKPLQALLAIAPTEAPHFGYRANIPLRAGYLDRTELDMRLTSTDDTLLVEAKLSETGFQTARPDLLARYKTFADTFHLDLLPRARGLFRSYQLLRSILAAQHHQARFAVFLDARRTDLIEDTFLIYRAVTSATLRSQLHLITWQEIAACVPRTLQSFLADKYGIQPSH